MKPKILVEEQESIQSNGIRVRTFLVRNQGESAWSGALVRQSGEMDAHCTACDSAPKAGCHHVQAVKQLLRKALATEDRHAMPAKKATRPTRIRQDDLRTLWRMLKDMENREMDLLLRTGTDPSPGSTRSTDMKRSQALRRVLSRIDGPASDK